MESLNQIEIRRLKVPCHIGVPEEERAVPQELLVTVKWTIFRNFATMGDDLAQTLDYAEAAEAVRNLAASRPRQLIETLAAEIASQAMEMEIVAAVDVTVEKFILPDTEWVAVHFRESRK